MKILITGANGYVARNLIKNFNDYSITVANREVLDLTNCYQAKEFFKNNFFDVVIHTASVGGNRLSEDNCNIFFQNCLMHQNILDNSQYFEKYLYFGSGAELDRRYNIDDTTELRDAFPVDPYGMSKNLIAKSGLMYPGFHNIRIFNVFNEDELHTRMIKANIINYIKKQPIIIHQDKFMDFFYMDDLCEVVKFVINSNTHQRLVNCSYTKKYKLSDIANIINNLSDYKVDIIIENSTWGLNYYGHYNLHLFDIKLKGIEKGIIETYMALLQTRNYI
jgi:GDP-L-fucose synthase